MAQLRFNIGVPGAGSAAREAESARETFRSPRPEAGSAARHAEEERRQAHSSGLRGAGVTTIRLGTAPQRNGVADHSLTSAAKQDGSPGQGVIPPGLPDPDPLLLPSEERRPASILTGPDTSAAVVSTRTPTAFNPLQTAAVKFRSLFRSIRSRAASEN